MSKFPPVLEASAVTPRIGTGYPAPLDQPCLTREKRQLGNRFGLDQFGVNLTTIPPGGWSAQRHWHASEDEFVYVVEGELILIDDSGEHRLGPGMCAGFKAGAANGHHLVNRSDRPAAYLEIGTRADVDRVDYPDVDLRAEKDAGAAFRFMRKSG